MAEKKATPNANPTDPKDQAAEAKMAQEEQKTVEDVTLDEKPSVPAVKTEVVQTRYAKVADIRDFYHGGAHSPQQVADHFNIDLKDALRILKLDEDQPAPVDKQTLRATFQA